MSEFDETMIYEEEGRKPLERKSTPTSPLLYFLGESSQQRHMRGVEERIEGRGGGQEAPASAGVLPLVLRGSSREGPMGP